MILGISSAMFSKTSVWEQIEAAERFHFSCVSFVDTDVISGMAEGMLQGLKNRLRQAGLSVWSIQSGADTKESLEASLSLAVFLGAKHVRVSPGEVDWLRAAAALTRTRGLSLVLDASDDLEACASLLDAIGMDHVGIALNPAALYAAGKPATASQVGQIAPRIFEVMVSDCIRLEAPTERRIGQGGVDWLMILKALEGMDSPRALIVNCVGEKGTGMPTRAALAKASMHDLKMLLGTAYDKDSWLHLSPNGPGMHAVIAPDISDCQSVWVYRLNLPRGETYRLSTKEQEMNVVLIAGQASIKAETIAEMLMPLDSFYLPGRQEALLTAREDCVFYIGAAVCEGYGKAFYRKFDLSLPLSDIHQMHGAGSGLREVFFTLEPGKPASRLLCGITYSMDGQWTSWPPHQHEKDLEEAYCYFDIPEGRFGMHLSYAESGDVEEMTVHPVRDGTMVLASRGYHPTVATPTMRNAYFWVLAAHAHESRRYDLAINDPAFSG